MLGRSSRIALVDGGGAVEDRCRSNRCGQDQLLGGLPGRLLERLQVKAVDEPAAGGRGPGVAAGAGRRDRGR